MQWLKTLFQSFSCATGLKINYHKSTLVPMHVPALEVARFVDILGCREGSFP
jgi:hypothetical protein